MATETLRLQLPRMSEERESAMIQAVGAVAGRTGPAWVRSPPLWGVRSLATDFFHVDCAVTLQLYVPRMSSVAVTSSVALLAVRP